MTYVLGWEDDFGSLFSVVMEFLVDVWESRKLGDNAFTGPQPNSSGWDLGQDGKLRNGRNGRSGKLSHSSDEIGACIKFVLVLICTYVCVTLPKVGAWSMAVLLRQLLLFIYLCTMLLSSHTPHVYYLLHFYTTYLFTIS